MEGGNDRTNPARYHPFYITDSKEGGFGQKTEEEQKLQRVFAGVSYDSEGYPYPTAAGRYCEWAHKTIDQSLESETFEDYFKTLRLQCGEGEPAYLNWTVSQETPDLLYYQVRGWHGLTRYFVFNFYLIMLMLTIFSSFVFSFLSLVNANYQQLTLTYIFQCFAHTNLGWKINVVNPGFRAPQQNGAMSYKLSCCLAFLVTLLTVFISSVR